VITPNTYLAESPLSRLHL